MKFCLQLIPAIAAGLAFTLAGCQDDTEFVDYDTAPASESSDTGHHHPSEGPHHGDLVELGDEQYHAEVVHDDAAGTVTVYILDGSATQAVAIDAAELTVNITHNETPEQFTLSASPEESDAEGKSSRFVSSESELAEHLDAEGASPQLVVMIEGKSFRGQIQHSHSHDHGDHDGHSADHEDHEEGHAADHETHSN